MTVLVFLIFCAPSITGSSQQPTSAVPLDSSSQWVVLGGFDVILDPLPSSGGALSGLRGVLQRVVVSSLKLLPTTRLEAPLLLETLSQPEGLLEYSNPTCTMRTGL